MLELENLVKEGYYDYKTKKTFQVRVIACLGDNLEQNQICGIVQNFSSTQHSCRKVGYTYAYRFFWRSKIAIIQKAKFVHSGFQ